MSELEKMISGEPYDAADEELVNKRNFAMKTLHEFNSTFDEGERLKILKTLIGKMGNECFITPSFRCDYGCNIELGDNVYFNFNCAILDSAIVKIGSNTLIGPNVQIYTPIHPIDVEERNTLVESAKPVTIGENCWLGGSVVVLPGVTIGSGTTIGAGSVVTKDIPSNVVAVGNPCKVIKQI